MEELGPTARERALARLMEMGRYAGPPKPSVWWRRLIGRWQRWRALRRIERFNTRLAGLQAAVDARERALNALRRNVVQPP